MKGQDGDRQGHKCAVNPAGFALKLAQTLPKTRLNRTARLDAEQRIWREWPSDLRILADLETSWSAF
jgi:hypothetical protein